ncbi:hypothetical protein M1B72_02645 [Geomonas paludis]|uniref:Uncharacterized protein n=1 Tax=Geomonas paludis TaxID=2740185 RepID=A0A6V8N048_9BACT|nr:protein DpdI [Geomonas paludis]UPU36622.1 hypothetical protein M1B72_02645 [Geomonas paludis]GFO65885.1 hypothetical protein GMPD_38040 [Geomonas paludis]
MALLERCQVLEKKRERLVALNADSQETTALKTFSNQLSTTVDEVTKAIELRTAYLLEQISLQEVDPQVVKEVSVALGHILERFKENPTRNALVTGSDWPTLANGAKALATSLRESCRQGWRAYTEAFFAQVEIVESKVVKTDTNIALLQEYRKLHRELQTLKSDWESISAVRSLKSRGKRLLELAKKLNEFDAPDEVKRFLDAVSTNGGAPLDLLSVEVVEWLKEQDLFSRYKIVVGGY